MAGLRQTPAALVDPVMANGTAEKITREEIWPRVESDPFFRMSAYFTVSARLTRAQREVVEKARIREREQIR